MKRLNPIASSIGVGTTYFLRIFLVGGDKEIKACENVSIGNTNHCRMMSLINKI